MRLPSRWVTNPESTLRQRADLIPRSALFLCPLIREEDAFKFDMGRASICHPPAQGTPPSRAAGNKATRTEKKRDARKRKALKKEGKRNRKGYVRRDRAAHRGKAPKKGRKEVRERRCRRDGAAHREKTEPPIPGTRTSASPKNHDFSGKPRLRWKKMNCPTPVIRTKASPKNPGSPGKTRSLESE